MKCSRAVCEAVLDSPYMIIWNDTDGGPRQYCVRCGRAIIEANRHDDLKLKHELVNPGSDPRQ